MKKVLKVLGTILAGLLGLVVVLFIAVIFLSNGRINRSYAIDPIELSIPSDAASIAEGERLFVTRGCPDCHGPDGEGKVILDDAMVGRFAGPNLTPGQGGIGGDMTEQDWLKAIRHGVGRDGQSLLIMPSNEYYPMSDGDLGTLVAYLLRLPPVDQESVSNQVGPLGRVLIVTKQASLLPAELIDHTAPRPAEVASGVTLEYGQYLAVTCTGCHGQGLSGGPIPGDPSPPPYPTNLTPEKETGLGNWSEADFITALRSGLRPDGSAIDPKMPWKGFSLMTDEELKALWLYMASVPAKPEGNR
ncbi:MAG: cytochrome c [Anaerolineales bacterium]|nr:cytochrome c [Anaerolineales bacterium]